ncbi:MAG: hypothetical protein OXU26_13580 [Acidobacteriota bacterium]|nr:hypothetical protein [Acidobacteriota bacterium]
MLRKDDQEVSMELTLPVETAEWLDRFREKIHRERQILGMLIAWGFAGAAFEIHRNIEARLKCIRETQGQSLDCQVPGYSDLLGREIRRILRSHYLESLGVPRARRNRRLLQGAYLNGFEETTSRLIRLYVPHWGEPPVISEDLEAA